MFQWHKNNLLKSYHEEGESSEHLDLNKSRKTHMWLKGTAWLVWFLIALIIALIINLWLVLPKASAIYQSANSAKAKLETGLSLFADKNFSAAEQKIKDAQDELSVARVNLDFINKTPLAWAPYLHSRLSELDKLLRLAENLTITAVELNHSVSEIMNLLPGQALPNYNQLTPQAKKIFWAKLTDMEPKLLAAKNDLDAINQQLASLSQQELIKYYQVDLVSIQSQLDELITNINQAQLLAKLLPQVFGYPDSSHYLFILQNNHELRPTGGFIGTYGVAEMRYGEIIKLETNDSYHLDMPVQNKFKVEPPAELKRYLKVSHWYFRDANWSPDWPTSAQKIAWFYQEENKLLPQSAPNDKFDFIIGITPDVIIDLLDITGPISVDGQTYTKNNFMDLLQETTEKSYVQQGLSSWNRKQVIGKLTKILQAKLISQIDTRRQEILDIFKNNLYQKNILVYSQDTQMAQYLRTVNWDGKVLATDQDYIMVVDANLAALKTDAVINRNIDYRLQETDKGLLAKLTINYAHTGKYTWKTGKYQSYTRVYIPEGSQLIKAAGFSGSEKDLVVGTELGKTYFGAYFELEPGKIGSLSFNYLLPYNTWQRLRAKQYSLNIQKQPGSDVKDLRVRLDFTKHIKSFEPTSLHAALAGNQINWQDNLDSDKRFSVTFY